MAIELHVQTITGRCDDLDEPSTAWKIDIDKFSKRELNQFYFYVCHVVRYIEKIIDEEIQGEQE